MTPAPIKKGDEVVIKFRGHKYKCIVITANYWGPEDGWYIEFTYADNGEYGYWKQGQDGGQLEEVKHNG